MQFLVRSKRLIEKGDVLLLNGSRSRNGIAFISLVDCGLMMAQDLLKLLTMLPLLAKLVPEGLSNDLSITEARLKGQLCLLKSSQFAVDALFFSA